MRNEPLTTNSTALAVSPVLVQRAIDEVKDFGDDKLATEHEALEGVMLKVVDAAGDDFDLTSKAIGEIEGMGGADATATDRATKFVELHSRAAGVHQVIAKRHQARAAKMQFLQEREAALLAEVGEVTEAKSKTAMTEISPSGMMLAAVCERYGVKAGDLNMMEIVKQHGDAGIAVQNDIDPAKFMNATVQTDQGWAPFVTRQPGFTRIIQRPIQVLDTLPSVSTTQHAIKIFIQTLRTIPGAADMSVAEGAASSEAAFEWNEYDEPMRELAAHVPITELQMEDVAQIRAIVDMDLAMGVRQVADGEVLMGPGTSDRIRGIAVPRTINGTAVNPLKRVWTKSSNVRSDQLKDLKRAKTQLKLQGRVMPTFVYMHDEVWDEIGLKETTAAGFYLGSPADDFTPRIWSLPVVLTDHLSSANTNTSTDINAVIVDPMYSRIYYRRGIHTEIGRINDQFIRRTMTIRAGLRMCIVTRRPQSVLTLANA